MTVDTACSGSLISLDVACRYLDSNQANGMIVAGANMWLNPEHNQETGMMRATQSASGKCHTFDAKADGYVKAEAINAVLLKRLDDAVRDGDPIRAIIRGSATNSSGRTPGIASPSPDAQAAAIRTAYANAGISNFNDTGYLECHGTGTLAGDPVEVAGAASVFAKTRGDGQELVIGSIKSNIGHSEAAAGISGLIKAILAVERGMIPGNPTFVDPNPNIDFKASRVRATRNTIPWPSTAKRRASVNSFGFGGANAHVVLDGADNSPHTSSYLQKISNNFFDLDEDDSQTTDIKPTVLVFSANNEESLKGNIDSLAAHLMSPAVSVDMGDLAYTLSERRSRHYHRAFAVTRSANSFPKDGIIFGKAKSSPPKIGFVFTGQGAQWSQMGLDLVNTFPTAKKVIQRLDDALQDLPTPPQWFLYKELTENRDSALLRQPEFSQPLVTALQLAILEVLEEWEIRPESVIGHSSGEIAGAVAAGLIKPEEAIKIAYFRGYAAKLLSKDTPLGMLAIGVSEDVLEKYMDPRDGVVEVACFNSPTSLTLSGEVSALEKVRDRLQEDGHFARMLLVDVAYHSSYMAQIGDEYEKLLLDHCKASDGIHGSSNSANNTRMFSSVTGKVMDRSPGASYWKANMVSPVRFSQAATELLQTQTAADFLIEIGPSNALSGPIAQIKKQLSGPAADTQYTAAMKRGADAILPIFDVAGRLFLSGGSVNLQKVHQHNPSRKPAVVVDLPNYSWNHSVKYWHETTASKDWRFKKFINHDVLGSKMNGTPWNSPVFKKTLKLGDLPWLRDHKLGSDVVFPAAGYIAMAIEAVYQTAWMTTWKEEAPPKHRFRLRDVKLSRALVLQEDSETRMMLSLTPVPGSTRSWFEFKVSSLRDDDTWMEHSTGLVRVEMEYRDKPAAPGAIEPLQHATSARSWYKAMADAGYNFGPAFQKHLSVEAMTGQRQTRSTVSLEPPPSSYGQSFYPMHPACIDGCFQTVSPALWEGDRTGVGAVLVPAVISSLVITGQSELPAVAISSASAQYLGIGRTDTPRNYGTSCSVYNPEDGSLLLELKGLKFGELEMGEENGPEHTFTRLTWNADLPTLLSSGEGKLREYLREKREEKSFVPDLVDLISHKNPTLKVLELSTRKNGATSVWLETESPTSEAIRAACSQYHFASTDPNALVSAQEKYSPVSPDAGFSLVDLSMPGQVVPDTQFDLAIVTVEPETSEEARKNIAESVVLSVHGSGLLVVVDNSHGTAMKAALAGTAFTNFHHVDKNAYLSRAEPPPAEDKEEIVTPKSGIAHVSLLQETPEGSLHILDSLQRRGWSIRVICDPLTEINSNDETVLIVDEVCTSTMNALDDRQWQVIQHLIQKECRILWVTSGGQLNVTDPTKAAINGFFRVLRAEEPLLRLITLDVEQPEAPTTAVGVDACLTLIHEDQAKKQIESEFVERNGVLHVSRVIPDPTLTSLQSDELSSLPTEVLDLHAHPNCVRLRAERLGNVDSIHFGEVSPDPIPLQDGSIEIELFAAGMNYKDVVVTMGIVPGNEHTLGGEGAGVVTKVSPSVTSFEVGQRVVVFDKGTFSNRIQTTPGRVHRIPDWMTFEEASTLCGVYLTSIYSLLEMANLRKGQRVLIHSAAGGVGIASIQVCQYVGAEVRNVISPPNQEKYRLTFNSNRSMPRWVQRTKGSTSNQRSSSRTIACSLQEAQHLRNRSWTLQTAKGST